MPTGRKHNENKFTQWFQECYLPIKFGIDKRRPHLSSMIHSGQMTREEAMKELEVPLVCDGMNTLENSHEMFVAWRAREPHEHSEYPTNEKWVKRWQKFFNVLKKYGYKS